MSFNPFYKKYVKPSLKRKRDEVEIIVPSSQPRQKKVKVYEVPDNSPAWNMPLPSGTPSGLYNISTGTKEYKFVDVSLGTGGTGGGSLTLNSGGAATFTLLNGLALGTSAFQRIGNKIAMKSLYWSLAFGQNALDADPATDTNVVNSPVRMMIVYDKQPNGSLPVVGDLLSAFSGIANTTARAIDINSPNNLNNKDRFVVIADKRFVLSSNGNSSRFIKKYKKLNTSVAYKSGATVGDITDITSGSLYFVAFRDAEMNNIADPVASVVMTGDIRLRYQDD